MPEKEKASPDHSFPARLRISGRDQFAALRASPVRTSAGPLLVYSSPGEREHHRLGLAVSRRVGSAVARNRIKRLLREAFRLSRDEFPGCYDLLITVRPHEELALGEYRQVLHEAALDLHKKWTTKLRKRSREE